MNSTFDTAHLFEGARAFSIELSNDQLRQFERYAQLLQSWNENLNLTAVPPEEYVKRHFLDSLSIAAAGEWQGAGRVADVGTGAGFPGLPLKIAFPHLTLFLIESLQKRCAFLQAVVGDLGLKDVHILPERGELAAHSPLLRESFDMATARAVAHSRILSEMLLPLLKLGGVMALLKGSDLEQELAESRETISLCGGSLAHIKHVAIASNAPASTIVVVNKVAPSPDKTPRAYAALSKRALSVRDIG